MKVKIKPTSLVIKHSAYAYDVHSFQVPGFKVIATQTNVDMQAISDFKPADAT